MNSEKMFAYNRQWTSHKLKKDGVYFQNLSQTHSPKILYIGCSDSRVMVEKFIGAEPGEVFVHRNIANIVSPTDNSVVSVIQYAVVHLKISHIIVCGHFQCGGVIASMQKQEPEVLDAWIDNIRCVYRLHQQTLDALSDEERHKKLVELNVQEQCRNLMTMPIVQDAYLQRNITIHGWIFNMASGLLHDCNIDYKKIFQDILNT